MELYKVSMWEAKHQSDAACLTKAIIKENSAPIMTDTVLKEYPDHFGADLVIVSRNTERNEAAVIRIQIKMGRTPSKLGTIRDQLQALVGTGWDKVRNHLTADNGILAGLSDGSITHYPVWIAATPPRGDYAKAFKEAGVTILTGLNMWEMCIPSVRVLAHDHRLYRSAYIFEDRDTAERVRADMVKVRARLDSRGRYKWRGITSTCKWDEAVAVPTDEDATRQ